MIDRIHWLGHGSFRLQGPPLIYIDPWRISRSAFLADVILISQADYAHCSPADVNKLRGPNTMVVADAAAAALLGGHDVQVLRPWQSLNVDRARITAVPTRPTAADDPSSPGGGLGYLIALDYYDIYYAGSVLASLEMGCLHPDIAILPVANSRDGFIGVEAAVEAVKMLQPRWVIPSHWDLDQGGGYLNVRALQEAIGDLAEVFIPEQVH